jgi:hypothetical protein
MAFFPASPTDGEYANVGNITYQWSTALGAWNRVGTSVTPLIDGQNVSISGNLQVSGSGISLFTTNITTTKALTSVLAISAGGNITGANLLTGGDIEAAGTIVGGVASITGTITSGGLTTGLITGSGVGLSGSLSTSAVGNVSTGNVVAINLVQGTTLSATGNLTVAGNVTTGGSASFPGNVSGGNLVTLGSVTAVGNVSGTYILGNGAFLTGISTGGGGGGVSLGSRSNVTVYTGSIANGASYVGSFTAYKGYALYKVATSMGAWVRIYTSILAQTADANRAMTSDPQPGAGVIAEVITLNPNTVTLISPGAIGYNDEATPSNAIPITIQNISGGNANIAVTFTVLQLEV